MKQDRKLIVSVIVATVLIFVVGIYLVSKSSKPKIYNSSSLIAEDSIRSYSQEPKVIIVEFGDYQCPACTVVNSGIDQVLKEYEDSVGIVFRHFPLPQHKNAIIASEAAEAAGEQGKYWQMHSLLYDKQAQWSSEADPLPLFLTYAQVLGINVDDFEKAIKEEKFKSKILKDQNDGQAIGINATPTLFISGEKFTGNPTYLNLKLKIDLLLK